LPTAYLQRGGIYLSRHDCAHAAADTASALQFKPDDREALALQARVHECLGNYPAAISDYQALAALSPNGIIFREEAIAYWITGDFAGAEKPLMQAVAIEPTSAYVALWLAVMRARAGDTAQPPAAKFDEDEWPGPVFALYAGKTTPQAVMAAAGKGSAADVIGHTCEANFYLAEWWLAQKQSATAWPLLAEANAKCPKDFIEHKLAVLELTHPHLENP
jgi:lipoprotein NlpI